MMVGTRLTIRLLHGTFHLSSAWDKEMSHLSRKGYCCVAPRLCFVVVGGHGKAMTNWHPCVGQVQQLLPAETSAGQDVVVVDHSLDGPASCGSTKGYADAKPFQLDEE
jgi:hypothetical protein